MIIVIGVAGVGKSTQCRLLSESGRYQWLSVGQYLRESVTDPLQKSAMLAGDILDDSFLLPHLKTKIFELGDSPELVIDGFPRTISQADWLIGLHEDSDIKVTHVLNLTANEDIARSRLLERGREDDSETAIEERFSYYRDNILPIAKHFSSVGLKVVDIDGQRSIDQVHDSILREIEGIK